MKKSLILWLIAFFSLLCTMIEIYKSSKPGKWVIFASIITFIIFLIPCSLLGSELNYQDLEMKKDTTILVKPVE